MVCVPTRKKQLYFGIIYRQHPQHNFFTQEIHKLY